VHHPFEGEDLGDVLYDITNDYRYRQESNFGWQMVNKYDDVVDDDADGSGGDRLVLTTVQWRFA